MQKKSVLPVLSILLINFVSAQFYSGYNRFSITDFFSSIDPQDMILMTLFIIIFAFINFSLGKIFRDSYGNPNKATAGVVSFSVTSLIVYGFWRTGLNFEGLFYNIGISSDLLYFIIPIILLVAAIIIVSKIGWTALFLIFGLLILLITIATDLIYEKGISLIIGVVLSLIGLWLWWRKRKGGSGYGGGNPEWFGSSPNYDYGGGRQKSPGFLKRRWGRYKDYNVEKTGQRYNQKLARQQKEYEQGMHRKEVKERAKRIDKIRRRREKLR